MSANHRNQGFSLIEVMAVIFVIGLALGMVSLTVSRGGPKDEVWDSIEKFLGIAQFASEKAILSGEAVGLLIEPPLWQAQRGQDLDEIGWRYRWVINSVSGWQDLSNIPAVSLPPSVELLIEIDDLEWEYEEQLDRTAPIAAYYPTGELTPFKIQFTDKRERGFVQNIEVDENGDLVWLEAPDPPEVSNNAF